MIWLSLLVAAYVAVTLWLIWLTYSVNGPRVLWSAWLWPLSLTQALYHDLRR